MIKDALKPFKHVRFSAEYVHTVESIPDFAGKKSKWFYTRLLKQKAKNAKAIKRWCDFFALDINWSSVTCNKIKNQFEVKIGEFNYKLINDILPTGSNLMRWKKIDDPTCIYC